MHTSKALTNFNQNDKVWPGLKSKIVAEIHGETADDQTHTD